MTAVKRVAIYARVSTSDQDVEVQLAELRPYVARRGWVLHAEFLDKGVSGAKDRRPGLDALMLAVRKRQVDVVLVWALDRLGRSLRHLVQTVEELAGLGVDLVSFTQPIDTTSPSGKLTFAVLAAVAEFERSMLKERVRAGIAKARSAGKHLGRPRKVLDLAEARRLLAAGGSWRSVARDLGTNSSTLRRALARPGVPEAPSLSASA